MGTFGTLRLDLGLGGRRPSFVGPLDAFAGQLYAVLGPHRALSSYTGPCWRVLRSSDNAETDIGFSPDGWANEAQMLAFARGSSLVIVRDYDKTGAGRDGVPPSSSNRPRCVLNGVPDVGPNGKPAPVYNGTSTFMNIEDSTGFSRDQAALTFATISRATGSAVQLLSYWPVSATIGSLRAGIFYGTASTVPNIQTRTTDAGTIVTLSGATVSLGAWSRIIARGRYAEGGVDIGVNGTTATNTSMSPAQNTPDSDQAANVRIGATTSSSAFLAGGIATTVLAQSEIDMAALEAALAQMMP